MFDFFTENNIIALKSLGDPLTIWEYHKIRGRTSLYLAENKLAASSTIICAVCSSEPRKVLYQLQDEVKFTMKEPWHYVSDDNPPFHIVIIRKLKMEYKNYPLLLFAPMRKFKEFLKHAIDNNRLEYVGYAYMLHPQETKEVLMMTGNIPIPEENVKFIVNDLTPERILRYIDVQDRLRGVDVQDRLRGVDVEDRLRGIDAEDRLNGLSREELKELQRLLNDKIAENER